MKNRKRLRSMFIFSMRKIGKYNNIVPENNFEKY